ncbi:MAG: methylated-DNA--[protein]-cysteine S-methyltransferase [Duodenibacillus sp.]
MTNPNAGTFVCTVGAPFGSIELHGNAEGLTRIRPTLRFAVGDASPAEPLRLWAECLENYLINGLGPTPEQTEALFAAPGFRALTPFARSVLRAVSTVACGQIVTYGDIARAVGAPDAARAVGGALAANPFPILIPCHRVMSAADVRAIDVTAPATLRGAAYMGEEKLTAVAAWLRMHDFSFAF